MPLSADYFEFRPEWMDEPPVVLSILEERDEESIRITRFKFLSRRLATGEEVQIYAILARPPGDEPHPAILLCHGGAACADQIKPAALSWARLGYVSICFDEPGICGPGNQSSGPWTAAASSLWKADPDLAHQSYFEAVVAGLRALALLRSRPEVDPSRVGVLGGSWGGYLTTMISGLAGSRVRAAFAVYGGGFFNQGTVYFESLIELDEERRRFWFETLDAGRWIDGIRCPFFLAAATNDHFFWPPSIEETWKNIRSPKNLVWSPNTSHCLDMPGGNTGPSPSDQNQHHALQEIPWMNYHLKGMGHPFPRCIPEVSPENPPAIFTAESPAQIRNATIWYSTGQETWTQRRWEALIPNPSSENTWQAPLPMETTFWFASVSDTRSITVSTPLQTGKIFR